MDRSFLSQFLNTYSQTLCGCLQQTMKILEEEINQSHITFKSIQNMLKPIPPDLKIICEDKKEYSTHKLLFGLLNTTLANIFLEEEFINDSVTLFLPLDSVFLEKDTFDDYSNALKNRLDKIISKVDVPFITEFVVPTSTSIAKIEKEEHTGVYQEVDTEAEEEEQKYRGDLDNEASNEIGLFEEGEIQPVPVKIKIRKKKDNTNIVEKQVKKRRIKSEYRCVNCKKLQRKGTNMEVHLIGCMQNPETIDKTKSAWNCMVVCPLCGKSVKRRIFESIHYYKCSNWTVPGSDLKKAKYESELKKKKAKDPIPCDECGKLLLNEYTLKAHMKHVHNSDKIFFHCDQCEFKTPNKGSLRGHIMSVHIAAYITCHICGKKVKGHKGQDRLRKHIRRHHEEQEMVKCDECGKEFRKDRLWTHKKNMHQERKYACNLCSYKAQSGFNLKLHISKSHLGVKELPKSKCQYCEVVTTNLPYHLKRYHPDH